MTQFSIVVPVYNSEQYLNRCIRSVLFQGYQNWELLLVDDGSSDGSGALLESFRETDPRIRVFHQENRASTMPGVPGSGMPGENTCCSWTATMSWEKIVWGSWTTGSKRIGRT